MTFDDLKNKIVSLIKTDNRTPSNISTTKKYVISYEELTNKLKIFETITTVEFNNDSKKIIITTEEKK